MGLSFDEALGQLSAIHDEAGLREDLRMAFVNEWISEEDMERYHFREIRKKW